jgi:hypothetical protein
MKMPDQHNETKHPHFLNFFVETVICLWLAVAAAVDVVMKIVFRQQKQSDRTHGDQIGRVFASRANVLLGHFFENLQKWSKNLCYFLMVIVAFN